MPLFPVAIAYHAPPEPCPVLSQKMESNYPVAFFRIVKLISSIWWPKDLFVCDNVISGVMKKDMALHYSESSPNNDIAWYWKEVVTLQQAYFIVVGDKWKHVESSNSNCCFWAPYITISLLVKLPLPLHYCLHLPSLHPSHSLAWFTVPLTISLWK